ncbi:hypothetical protein Scep_028962 [Stephania cephalantha]|uniref:DUF7722 domain-containing protein n=1 Tax=Stephania cephalantha TaxID=152367 RepID=A0AAP0HNX1_9MAGN
MALNWLVHTVCAASFGYASNDVKLRHESGLSYVDGSSNKKDDVNNGGIKCVSSEFQMPLHYPRYKKGDYENMEEWRLDNLLSQYGLTCEGSLDEKRSYAMGAFLWPDQL